jgi:hypothetical protein
MSFKLGEGERLSGGRLFIDHTEASLRLALAPLPLGAAEVWLSEDVRRGRRRERWVNAIATRQDGG